MLHLYVVPAEGAPFEHPLDGESLVMGRSSQAELVIADRFLSRRHARLFRDRERLLLEDLGSRNGTYLNDQPVEAPTVVRPGDVIKLSGTVITVREGVQETRTTQTGMELGHTVFRRASDLVESARSSSGALKSEAALRRYAERLRILNEVHRALAQSVALDELLQLILDRAFEHLSPEKGVIFLKGADGELYRAASRTVSKDDSEIVYSQTLVREVTEKGLAALVLDAATDERFAQAQSILSSGIRSLVAAPLLDPEGALGMIALDSRLNVRQFSEDDMELLVCLASVAAMRIRNLALTEEAAERRRLEAELTLARRIQVALLPSQLPELDGYELEAGNAPSRGVSGDFYEVVLRAEGTEAALMLADVSGKGVGASLLTASLEALSAGPIESGRSPEDICTRVSRRLYARTSPEKYATAFLAVLEASSGRLVYTNAGHNAAILLRTSGECETLEATGTPLGLLPVSTYTARECAIDPGDLLVIYTDGITEAVNSRDEEYGLERLIAVCREHRALPPEGLREAIETDLEAFVQGVPYADDRTMVILKRK